MSTGRCCPVTFVGVAEAPEANRGDEMMAESGWRWVRQPAEVLRMVMPSYSTASCCCSGRRNQRVSGGKEARERAALLRADRL